MFLVSSQMTTADRFKANVRCEIRLLVLIEILFCNVSLEMIRSYEDILSMNSTHFWKIITVLTYYILSLSLLDSKMQ